MLCHCHGVALLDPSLSGKHVCRVSSNTPRVLGESHGGTESAQPIPCFLIPDWPLGRHITHLQPSDPRLIRRTSEPHIGDPCLRCPVRCVHLLGVLAQPWKNSWKVQFLPEKWLWGSAGKDTSMGNFCKNPLGLSI